MAECKVKSGDTTDFGTTLIIEKINSRYWNSDTYKKLRDRLARLISPLDQESKFSIVLYYKGEKHDLETHKFLNEPRYSIEGKIFTEENSSDAKIQGTMSYWDQENGDANPTKKKESIGNGELLKTPLQCGDFDFDIKVWDRDVKSLNAIVEKFNLINKREEVKEVLDLYCGVSLYRDGFRIYPYGDQGNDWLALDKDSRQNPTKHLANNQVIGTIRITKNNNPNLIDKTSREGLQGNEAYFSLINVIKKEIFPKIQDQRYKLRRKGKNIKYSIPESVEIIKINFAKIKNEFQSGELTHKTIIEAEENVVARLTEIELLYSRLTFSAGLGQLAHIMVHEIRAPIGKISREIFLLNDDMEKANLNLNLYQSYKERVNKISKWMNQHEDICKRLDINMPNKSGKAQSFEVREEIAASIAFYSPLAKSKKIELKLIDPDNKKVFMSQSVVSQIVLNLIDNAIYWVDEKWKKNGDGKIHIKINNIATGFSITIEDNGIGVDSETKNEIFDIYYSKKLNGHGIGLYLCKVLIERYGNIYYSEKSDLGGACFVARFEKGVGG